MGTFHQLLIYYVLSKRIDTKKAPDLKFKYDESLEYGKRIEELLKQTK